MSQTLTPMLGAMVICRSLARFIGYPPLHDATFTNTPLLHHFSAVLDARAQSHTLWHLTPTDVSVIFTPLLDYAERSSPRMLHAADIAHMQTQLTFAAAHALAKELDALTRGAQPPSWERWFALVLWARRRLDADADADDADDADIASANFYASCLSLCPPPPPPPRSTPTPTASPPPTITTTTEEAAADPFLSPHWTIASELRGDGAFALSPRMARLLAGSTPESFNTNWLNRGRYGRAPLKG